MGEGLLAHRQWADKSLPCTCNACLEIDRLVEAHDRVRELHTPGHWPYKLREGWSSYPYGEYAPPSADAQVCEHCTHTHGDPHYDNVVDYPCPTLQALDQKNDQSARG